MFEMKNEMESDGRKHKNEDFFRKLNDDRNKKGCEYAVLVSLLEPDSELYNGGIVDVSHRYPKMYVIRPQFFIPLITLLVQMARKNVGLQKELIQAKSLSVDITTFEGKLDEFKEKFGNDARLVRKGFDAAIAAIDKSIKDLQAVKDNLLSSGNHMRLANDKLDGLTIRKLTFKNPTMKALFDEARKNGNKIEEIKDESEDAELADIIEESDFMVEDNNEGYDNSSSEETKETHTTTTRKANVGDTIMRTSDNHIGKVIEIQTTANGLEKLILELEDGSKGSVYNNTRLYQVVEV